MVEPNIEHLTMEHLKMEHLKMEYLKMENSNDARNVRPSVLARLFEDVNCEEYGKGPTLKDYMSASQGQPMNSMFLTKSSINRIKDSDDVRDKFRRRDFLTAHGAKSIDNVLFLQHGKKVYRKISSDYVKTIGQIEHKQKNSIRTVEYAKTRPSITVKEYQKKNQQYQENLMKSTTALENSKENREKINSTKNNDPKFIEGLRLPGDSPLYASFTEVTDLSK